MHLEVVDFRSWNSFEVSDSEIDAVLASEARCGGAILQFLGAHKHFSAAKKRFFESPIDERATMTSTTNFIQFRQSIVVDSAMATPLKHYQTMQVLFYLPARCPAMRRGPSQPRMVSAIHNGLGWPMIRMHLIGAEDVVGEGYRYDMVAQSRGATLRRRRRTSQNVRKPRKHTCTWRKDNNTPPASGEYNDNLADMSNGTSSWSSFASITTGS